MRISVTCGYPTSQHAISLITQLKKFGHEIPLCLEVSILNKNRILREIRFLGIKGLLNKAHDRILKKSDSKISKEVYYIRKYNQSLGIKYNTVGDVCHSFRIKHLVVSSLNDRKSLEALRTCSPDLVIYAGGGILKQAFLKIPKIGVLNAHGGPLPHFRGMNASEWSILFGFKPVVTIHFIDKGIDTGPILKRIPINIDKSDSISDVRGKATVVGVKGLIETVTNIESGNYTLENQDKNSGRQFFRMSNYLLDLVEERLRTGNLIDYDPNYDIFH